MRYNKKENIIIMEQKLVYFFFYWSFKCWTIFSIFW